MKSTVILPHDERLSQDDIEFIEKNSDDKTKALLVKYHKALTALEEQYGEQLTWSEPDVEQQAKNEDIELTEDEISDVLELVLRRKDASLGISWDTISWGISEIVSRRTNES